MASTCREVPRPGEVQIRSPELLKNRPYDRQYTHIRSWEYMSYIMQVQFIYLLKFIQLINPDTNI